MPWILHLGSESQKQRYLPDMISGHVLSAIAMTERGAGSDLAATRSTAKRTDSRYSEVDAHRDAV